MVTHGTIRSFCWNIWSAYQWTHVRVTVTERSTGSPGEHMTPGRYQAWNTATGFLHLDPSILSPKHRAPDELSTPEPAGK